MKNACMAILLAALAPVAFAQVRVDRPIVLEGATPDQRQLRGIEAHNEPTGALSAAMEVSGSYRTATPGAALVWELQFDGLEGPLEAGTHLLVKAPAPSSPAGPLELSVNGAGPYEVISAPNVPVVNDQVLEGTMLSLVFNGTAFQLMNGLVHQRRACPTDMVAIDEQNCIEPLERAAQTFYDASLACMAENKRLCTWAEFHLACQQRDELGLQAMVNNWEWTNSSADHNFNLRVVGQTNCTASTRMHGGTISNPYRCCYTR